MRVTIKGRAAVHRPTLRTTGNESRKQALQQRIYNLDQEIQTLERKHYRAQDRHYRLNQESQRLENRAVQLDGQIYRVEYDISGLEGKRLAAIRNRDHARTGRERDHWQNKVWKLDAQLERKYEQRDQLKYALSENQEERYRTSDKIQRLEYRISNIEERIQSCKDERERCQDELNRLESQY